MFPLWKESRGFPCQKCVSSHPVCCLLCHWLHPASLCGMGMAVGNLQVAEDSSVGSQPVPRWDPWTPAALPCNSLGKQDRLLASPLVLVAVRCPTFAGSSGMPFPIPAVGWREAYGSHLSVVSACSWVPEALSALLWEVRRSLHAFGMSRDFPALGIAACALHLPRCSFIFMPRLSPPPWGCCPGQTLRVALPRAAPCWDVVPMYRGNTPGLLGEFGSDSWAVGLASL